MLSACTLIVAVICTLCHVECIIPQTSSITLCGDTKNTTFVYPHDFVSMFHVVDTGSGYKIFSFSPVSKIGTYTSILLRYFSTDYNIGIKETQAPSGAFPVNRNIWPSHVSNVTCSTTGLKRKFMVPKLSAHNRPGAEVLFMVNGTVWMPSQMSSLENYCARKTEDISEPFYMYWEMSGTCDNTVPADHDEANPCKITYTVVKGVVMFKLMDTSDSHGTVTYHTGQTSKSIRCKKMPCKFNVQVERTITITCPSGKNFEFAEFHDLAKDCPLANVEYFRSAAIHICRATAWPSAFWALIFMVIVGQWCLMAINWALYYILKAMMRCLRSTSLSKINLKFLKMDKDMDILHAKEEEGIEHTCNFCGQMFCSEDYTKVLHNKCDSNMCPYCGKKFAIQGKLAFENHVQSCPNKDHAVTMAKAASGDLVGEWSITGWVEKATQCQWNIIIIILILFCITPAYGAPSNDSMAPIVTEDQPESLPFVWEPTVLEVKKSRYDDIVKRCGTVCPIVDGRCTCPRSQDYQSDEAISVGDPLLNSVVGLGNVHRHRHGSRNNVISWTSLEEDDNGQIKVDGVMSGFMKAASGEQLVILGTHEKSTKPLEIKILIKSYEIKYTYLSDNVIYDRSIHTDEDWTCNTPCTPTAKKAFGYDNDEPMAKVMEFTGVNRAGMIPSWCWRVDKGCINCGMIAKVQNSTKVIIKGKVSNPVVEAVICMTVNSGKQHCETVNEGTKLVHEYGITVIIGQLPSATSTISDGSTVFTALEKTPGGVWAVEGSNIMFTTDQIPDTLPAPHGYPGDTYSANLTPLIVGNKGVLASNLDSVQMGFGLRSWSNPYCNFKNIKHIITPAMDAIIYNTDGRSPRLHLVSSKLVISDETIGGTFNIKGVALNELSITGEIKEYRLDIIDPILQTGVVSKLNCTGLVGTLSGFTCDVILTDMTVTAQLNLRLKSTTDHIILSDEVYTIIPTKLTYDIKVTGIALGMVQEITMCLPTKVASCGTGKADLKFRPDLYLAPRESAHLDSTQQKDSCTGVEWFACSGWSIGNFFKNIWPAFIYVKWILGLIIVSIIVWVLIRLTFFIARKLRGTKIAEIKEKIDKKLLELDDDAVLGDNEIANLLRSPDIKPEPVKKLVNAANVKMGKGLEKVSGALKARQAKVKAFMKAKQK